MDIDSDGESHSIMVGDDDYLFDGTTLLSISFLYSA